MNTILTISDRGQITIPKKVRALLATNYVECSVKDGQLILSPVQTKEEFLNELDAVYEDWKKQGGHTLQDVKKVL